MSDCRKTFNVKFVCTRCKGEGPSYLGKTMTAHSNEFKKLRQRTSSWLILPRGTLCPNCARGYRSLKREEDRVKFWQGD